MRTPAGDRKSLLRIEPAPHVAVVVLLAQLLRLESEPRPLEENAIFFFVEIKPGIRMHPLDGRSKTACANLGTRKTGVN